MKITKLYHKVITKLKNTVKGYKLSVMSKSEGPKVKCGDCI